MNTLPVRVKRKDSTIQVANLMDEFEALVNQDFPKFHQQFIKFPATFRYSKAMLQDIEGFPGLARERFRRQLASGTAVDRRLDKWDEKAVAEMAEEKVYNSMVRTFQPRVALLWSGLKMEKVVKVARESVQYDANQERSRQPHLVEVHLTPSEINFYKVFGLDCAKIDQEVTTLTDHLFSTATNPDLPLNAVLGNLTQALRAVKPVFQDITEEAQKTYRSSIEKKIKAVFKGRRTLTKDEVKASLTRYFISLLDKKDEFDSIVCDQATSTIFHLETKSFPQVAIMEIVSCLCLVS